MLDLWDSLYQTEPVARATDPDTSHEAAATITPVTLRASQDAVLYVLREYGPMCDTDLIARYRQYADIEALPKQSDSGIRTRRKELVTLGRVVLHGETTLESGNRSKTWRALRADGGA